MRFMEKSIDMSTLGHGILAAAVAALSMIANGADEVRVRAVADEVGGTVTWRDARRQPTRVRGEALSIAELAALSDIIGAGR